MVKVKSNVAFEPINIENCSRILKKLTRKLESFIIVSILKIVLDYLFENLYDLLYYLNKKIYLNIYYLYLFTFYLKI